MGSAVVRDSVRLVEGRLGDLGDVDCRRADGVVG